MRPFVPFTNSVRKRPTSSALASGFTPALSLQRARIGTRARNVRSWPKADALDRYALFVALPRAERLEDHEALLPWRIRLEVA